MSTIKRIYEAAFEFELTTGRRPTKLYLGHIDKAEVRAELRPHEYWIEYGGRTRIYGMELYEVDAEYHIAVSI